MLMLKAVPPMNFARTDPGESVTQPVLSPNSISETYKSAGAAPSAAPAPLYLSKILFGAITCRVSTFAWVCPGEIHWWNSF